MTERSIPEQRLFMMNKVLPHLKQHITEKVPQSGWKDKATGVGAALVGTENKYLYQVEKDLTDPDGVLLRLKLCVVRAGHDREVSHYKCKGTKLDILDEIDRMMENPEACVQEVMELSRRIDEFYK